MLTRVFLAAGVAALAVTAPAMAGPGGDHHEEGGQHSGGPPRGGGDEGHGGGGDRGEQRGGATFIGGAGGGGRGHGEGGEASTGLGTGGDGRGRGGGEERYGGFRGAGGGFSGTQERGSSARRQATFYERQEGRDYGRQEARSSVPQRASGYGRQQARWVLRPPSRDFATPPAARSFAQHQEHRFAYPEGNMPQGRDRFASQRQQALENVQPGGRGMRVGTAQMAGGQFDGNAAEDASRQLAGRQFANPAPYSALSYGNNVQVRPFDQASRFIGAPVAQVAATAALAPLPASMQYLYPDTPSYYYRYGDGYLYQVNRSTDLIAALIPLVAGGYLPGEYLPSEYMSEDVPDDYGYGAFYPDYGELCNRYYRGVVYQVDCEDGYVENVIPIYANGYGVGELLPSAYGYYNLPMQYRGLYYDTPDAAYWYSPGAIYQYDPRTSVITSVAALMGPGLAVGQALPVGYTAYNVPVAYRSAYYDSPSAWYRYSNGYIYQVDPATRMVTAIVASLLT